MTGQPGRIPDSEPSVKSVLAALARAQEVAMARAAAVRDRQASDESAGGHRDYGPPRGTDQHNPAPKQSDE